jgi:ATP-dependent DNA helicase DinG
LLAAGGPVARSLPAYEARSGQLDMADAVQAALANERVLLCEAGTGTGKTLAYLIPAILSGKKVVVSTATRTLQEQIVTNDLPLIRRALGLDTRAAVMKGLGNYVCRRRYADYSASADSLWPRRARSLAELERWVSESDSGDVVELVALPESDPVWREVTSSSDTRIGATCRYYDECFVTRMKRDADAARLVIVNHHLFFADLALRGPHPGHVIPDYDAVIFDEAHTLEDVATQFFGLRVSRARLERLLGDAERALGRRDARDERADALVDHVRSASNALWHALSGLEAARGDARATLERDAWYGAPEKCWHALDSALETLAAHCETARVRLEPNAPVAEALEVSARRAEQARVDLGAIVDGAPGRVTWLELSAQSAALSSSLVDLSAVFRERVFEALPAVVLTSATLTSVTPSDASASPFAFVRARLGLASGDLDVAELVVPSPFDFEHHALLYTPNDLPSPGDARFIEAAVTRVAELVEITGGGAFVLTTSLGVMRALYAGLSTRLAAFRLLLQGDAPKSALIDAFRAEGNAVLVATLSFWQGVDVPGRALRLVVLDKIPFSVPTDPIVHARSQALEAAGGNPFMELSVPAAAITLKQGFGRLIRTGSDRGIVALLDPRVHRRGYGKKLLAALPPARRTRELDEVRAFWAAA